MDQNKANPMGLPESEFISSFERGLIHTLQYPVSTGVHFPFRPFDEMFSGRSSSWFKKPVQKIIRKVTGSKSLIDVQKSMGLPAFPKANSFSLGSPYYIPKSYPFNSSQQRMGFTLKQSDGLSLFTVSCAQCHSANLFGRSVIGLSNRFPRPNEFFVRAKQMFDWVPLSTLRLGSKFSRAEFRQLKKSKKQLAYVGAKKPVQLGLDTSLAQVALSLSLRNDDEEASFPWRPKQRSYSHHPLNRQVADSKPMVWWNLKYKNRWLADGSVVSGNPVLTNILWNELGRGADLQELSKWMENNQKVIQELTTAVFASEAPRLTDFIDPSYFSDWNRLQQGQNVYRKNCARCHGIYVKNWEDPVLSESVEDLSFLIETKKVLYSESTPVVDVGTSSERYKGMKYLVGLNQLAISKKFGIRIQPQKGYVPPPLVGVWARWPYFHNNSIPSLCELLTPEKDRVSRYLAVPPKSLERDFDMACNGYPEAEREKLHQSNPFVFEANPKKGLGHQGHDLGILRNQLGQEVLSAQDKWDLIYYLQTL